jgi:Domain of unknown function (DUF4262)
MTVMQMEASIDWQERRAKNDLRVAADIKEFGCHVISVFADYKEKVPSFTYSVGIKESCGKPDAIVIGVRAELGGFMINEYHRQVLAGKIFSRGKKYRGFLEGFPIYVEPVVKQKHREYMLGCNRYYSDQDYRAVQLIYPTTKGKWVWSKLAPEFYLRNQPKLGRNRPHWP